MRRVLLLCVLATGCNTFGSLAGPSGGDTSQDAANDVTNDVGDRDTHSDATTDATIDLSVDQRVDMPPANPYDLTASDDFFELTRVPATNPRSFTISAHADGVYVGWVQGIAEIELREAELPSLNSGLPESATLPISYAARPPLLELYPNDPQLALWTLGRQNVAGRTAIVITDPACGANMGDDEFAWYHENSPNNGPTFLAEQGGVCEPTVRDAHDPFVVGGLNTDTALTAGSYAFGFWRDETLFRRPAFLPETLEGFDCASQTCSAFLPGAITSTIPTHGHRVFFWMGNQQIRSIDMIDTAQFTVFQNYVEVSSIEPDVVYLGTESNEQLYALFYVDNNALVATQIGGTNSVLHQGAVSHISATPVRRDGESGTRNLVVLATVEKDAGEDFFVERVISFDDDAITTLACRRRFFPSSVTKIDIKVGAFQRGNGIIAPALSPHTQGGGTFFSLEGFYFPNLLLPRDEALTRRDQRCQTHRPL